ncbi:MAG: hypothetical protein AAF970_01260 [Bacteroidota bacterium]
MADFNERSAYPHPEEFKVMRPEYVEAEDGDIQASITITPFRVAGRSSTKPGARRAALYEAEKTYRNYHPSYRIPSPFPDVFMDREGVRWNRVPVQRRNDLGDYRFTDADGEEDFADIEQMLMWDVRPKPEDS